MEQVWREAIQVEGGNPSEQVWREAIQVEQVWREAIQVEQVWREAIQVEQVWTNGGGDGYEVGGIMLLNVMITC